MSLRQSLKKGDWVRASKLTEHYVTDASGVIEGQAAHNMSRSSHVELEIVLDEKTSVVVNVNTWAIEMVRRNSIPYDPPVPAYEASDL